jgi:hypothetical protein
MHLNRIQDWANSFWDQEQQAFIFIKNLNCMMTQNLRYQMYNERKINIF